MDAVRKSFRIAELAQRHALSVAFIYNEIKAKRLRARKAGAATIVTDEMRPHGSRRCRSSGAPLATTSRTLRRSPITTLTLPEKPRATVWPRRGSLFVPNRQVRN